MLHRLLSSSSSSSSTSPPLPGAIDQLRPSCSTQASVTRLTGPMPPKKRGMEEGGGGARDGGGPPPSPVLKKRCRSFDLEIRGCRHLQELAASCAQSVQIRLEAALESAVARIPDEVTKALTSFFSHAPRTLVDQSPKYKLSFMNGLSKEVFTKKVIHTTDGEPLKICMVVVNDPQGTIPHHLLSAKIKFVVLDGDFNRHNQEGWVPEEFKNYIVRPRDKVGVVLIGVSELSLKNGEAYLHEASFTDNSKFVRSGQFRLGVMVDDNLGERVLEGITEPFIVKDRRSEGNKKHDIPLLDDNVWRLKKISKDGVLHKALGRKGICSVKDFLRLYYYKDEQALREILIKATESIWNIIVEHAKKCNPGKGLYSFHMKGDNVTLFFNSVYQIIGATFDDNYSPFNDLDKSMKDLVGQWSRDAYKNMTCDQPDYEMENGKPRPISQSVFQGIGLLEHKFADLMQGHICEDKRNVCQTDNEEGNPGSNSKQCPLKRLGSVRITQNDEDTSLDFSIFLDSNPEQYFPSTSAIDTAGLVTLHCSATAANEITGASLTMDHEVYDMPFTNNDFSVPWLCEEQGTEQKSRVGASLCAVNSMAACPIYSRHSSFNEVDCHETLAVGAEPSV